jgi:hypothetical protein
MPLHMSLQSVSCIQVTVAAAFPDEGNSSKLNVFVLCPGHGGAIAEEPGGADAQPEVARGRGG